MLKLKKFLTLFGKPQRTFLNLQSAPTIRGIKNVKNCHFGLSKNVKNPYQYLEHKCIIYRFKTFFGLWAKKPNEKKLFNTKKILYVNKIAFQRDIHNVLLQTVKWK